MKRFLSSDANNINLGDDLRIVDSCQKSNYPPIAPPHHGKPGKVHYAQRSRIISMSGDVGPLCHLLIMWVV